MLKLGLQSITAGSQIHSMTDEACFQRDTSAVLRLRMQSSLAGLLYSFSEPWLCLIIPDTLHVLYNETVMLSML